MKTYLETEFGLWEKCHIPGCKKGVCYALDSEYCFPHTKSKNILDKFMRGIKRTVLTPTTTG